MSEVENLGHITKHGIRVNPSKTEALMNLPSPTTNVKELQSFIGGINFYSTFIADMASVCQPLYMLLQKDKEWTWDTPQQSAFETLKYNLTKFPVLAVYGTNLSLKLDCDASQYGLGAVLSKVYPYGDEKPIAFGSRPLSSNYSWS